MPTLALVLAVANSATPGAAGLDMTRYALVCAGLVLLVAGLGIGFRKLAGKALGARAAKRSLAVMDVLPLGGKQRLVVVRCYDRTFALGVGEKEVHLLTELDAVIAPAREALPAAADRKSFADTLAALEQSPATVLAEPRNPKNNGAALGAARSAAADLPPQPLAQRTIEPARAPARLAREGVLG